jgi:hypothetical protein
LSTPGQRSHPEPTRAPRRSPTSSHHSNGPTGDVGLQWSEGFTAYNASVKITKPHFVLGTPTEYSSSATRAYIVLPGTFTPLMNGKPFTETGFWTFVEVRDGAVWRVASQTWAGVTFK